jgi:hypothetical protein
MNATLVNNPAIIMPRLLPAPGGVRRTEAADDESFPLPHRPRGARRGEAFRLRLETGTMGHAVRLI